MELKPLFETNTINLAMENKVVLKKVVKADPEGVIPNGIYGVLKWEKIRINLGIILSSVGLFISIILITTFSLSTGSTFWSYITPVLIAIISGAFLLVRIYDVIYHNKAVKIYRDNIRVGATNAPLHINKIYKKTIINQISHNWATFILLFYGIITTLMLYWMKDFSWWIFDFKTLINSFFISGDTMVVLFTIGLLSIIVLHIWMMISRKKTLLDIDAFYGEQIIDESIIIQIKTSHNKGWRRGFIISVMLFLIIPLIVKMALRIWRGKK